MHITHSLTEASASPGTTCVALGLFDGVHIGHQAVLDEMLKQAARRALTPAVFTFTMRGHVPQGKRSATRLMSDSHFASLTRGLGVEWLCKPDFYEFKDMEPESFVREILLEKLGAKCVVCGWDFRFGKNAGGDAALLRELGARLGLDVLIIPAVQLDGEAVSSTAIRRCVEMGEMEQAGRMLGRRFAIDFEVIHGNHIGHTLGWPTINQAFPESFTLPRFGVYATLTTVDGVVHSSVTNVGVKPTVGSEKVLAETYIQDFSGDLYTRCVPVEFLRFTRPEQRFASLDELKAQITSDAESAARIAAPYLNA